MIKTKKNIKKLIRTLDRYSPYPLFFKFRMSIDEKKTFNKYIMNSKHYLEFGSGGSTLHTLLKSKTRIYSVESSLDWINYMCKYLIINFSLKKRLFFYYADIGKTKEWGFPISNDSKEIFPNYSNDIFNSVDSNTLDIVLIDGRFRVACLLSVILNMSSTEDTTILFHDFWNREKYHIVLKYVTEIERVDTLAVFRIKNKLDLSLVKRDYEIYKYIPD